MSALRSRARQLRNLKLAVVERDPRPAHPELVLRTEDEEYLTRPYDPSTPLPADAAGLEAADNPRLRELREAYAALDLPPLRGSRWTREAVDGFLDRRYFRGDSLITWHYRELRRATALKYFVYAQYVAAHDERGLLERLREDGAFGCWTFSYPGHPRYSRDLLESVGEIGFLERQLDLSGRERFSVLDIGAGYGRLAHRMCEAYDNVADYCCVDAVPESTFLCEYYLRHRGVSPPARSLPLHELDSGLEPGSFDLAVNVHSFPECTYEAVEWWITLVASLEVPAVLIVPNEPTELLTLEPDGTRRDFMPLMRGAGYELVSREPVIRDPAVRDLVRVDDHFHLFARTG
jgi:putative sugar O-methyltransferase